MLRARVYRATAYWMVRYRKSLTVMGIALASSLHMFAAVPTYTGCYSPSSGTINKLSLGWSPQKPCNSGDVQVSFSAGDITKITVSGGLIGGGDNGDVTVSLDSKYSLPQSCLAMQVAKWTGTAWQCANDEDTTYSAGTGLNLASGQFSIMSAFQLPQSCANGNVPKSNGSGGWDCGTDNDSGLPELWTTYVPISDGWSNNWPTDPGSSGSEAYVAKLTVPAGTYIVNATAIATADENQQGLNLDLACQLEQNRDTGHFIGSSWVAFEGPSGKISKGMIAMTTVATFGAPGTIDMGCWADAEQHLENIKIVAFKAGVVHAQ